MNLVVRKIRLLLVIACFAILSAGCATSQGSHRLTSPPQGEVKLAKYTDLCVEVTCSKGVSISTSDADRIKDLIVKYVPTECPIPFKCIDQPDPGKDTILAKVNITKYDEGNSFARLMLAGLGQMHIDANVGLTDYATGNQLFRSEVKKSFAWGGLYGGSTQITDIEEGFAKAVAASFSGKD